MAKVLTFKLITGEEIIGREVENISPNPPYFTLDRVRTVGVQPAGNGQMGIGLLPFAFSQQDGPIMITKSAVIAEFTCTAQLERIYLEQTSGIKLT